MSSPNLRQRRLPSWLIKKDHFLSKTHEMKSRLRNLGLHTVCEEARCPNLCECFERGTATFMIMGNICTRSCKFCNVRTGIPGPLDPKEPSRVASMAAMLNLSHVVVTSVTRDDLEDSGASHFADTIRAIRSKGLARHCESAKGGRSNLPCTSENKGIASSPFVEIRAPRNDGLSDITVEVLVPDFKGSAESIRVVCEAGPDVFNHNVETVPRLTPIVRNKASYETSLKVLETARSFDSRMKLKSGLMVGMGETKEEVQRTLKDLFKVGCNIVTIGQYLQPNKVKLKVKEFLEPSVFEEYKEFGEAIGLDEVFAGPLVRSSYMAERFV